MVQADTGKAATTERKRRGRGATKTFPLSSFEDVLPLAKAIQEHGLSGSLRRTTVFDRLERSAEGGSSRRLVTDSARYGLTSGSYAAPNLKLTEAGAKVVDPQTPSRERRRIEFDLAIQRVDAFNQLYERLKAGRRVPALDVMKDQLGTIPEADRQQAASVFLDNVRYLGLIRMEAKAERLIAIEEALEELPTELPAEEPIVEPEPPRVGDERNEPPTRHAATEPTVHIDVNIHINSDASADQIDQLFASMARHLYRKD
ncbi:MAG: hypothetical protein A2Y74_08365 [Actinobacteria bacterium RBG_13_63_9]|nr:MAG: hypothetical protein A2Y74_08365 [Actinobacteria bacterium RBG_13_63_9]